MLIQSGCEVYSVTDGKTGVEVVRLQKANVFILDIGLPDIDGFELLRGARYFSDAYVVMVTDWDEVPGFFGTRSATRSTALSVR